MKNKNKHFLLRTVVFISTLFIANIAFAHGHDHDGIAINTGVINPCQQLWLVTDPNNANELPPPDGMGVCVDVPVNYHGKVKVVFNLDSPVMSGPNSVGLRHMVMLSTVLQHQIEIGNLRPENVSVIGIFHGSAMGSAHWPFKDSPVKGLVEQVLSFNHKSTPVHTQLEVCGVTLKGMMMHHAARLDDPSTLLNKSQLIDGVLVDQGAIARLTYLEKHGYSYIQEGGIDVDK